jgi:hypothetical protein
MKKYLLPEKGKFYKANLHMHTVFSDGGFTLEQAKEEFMRRGYSIIAFTDHDVFVPHQELTDENFLAINSVEIHCHTKEKDFGYVKAYHFNLYAKTPDITLCPVCDIRYVNPPKWIYVDEAHRQVCFEREYSVENMNKLIALANEAGFLTCYNHPVWSLQDFTDYIGLEGLWGIEVYNTGSALEGGYVDQTGPFLDLCRRGKMVAPIAADDAHALSHSFGGWTMVKAEKLEYETVMQAYERGDFYASTGVEIYDLYMEDGKLVVECSPDCRIDLRTERRYDKHEYGRRAEFDLNDYIKASNYENKCWKQFVYLEITRKDGAKAWTRAYTLDELQ